MMILIREENAIELKKENRFIVILVEIAYGGAVLKTRNRKGEKMQEKKKLGRPKKDTVLWICDQTRCAPEVAMCKIEKYGCVHTSDSKFAKNKVVGEPSLYPERFVEDDEGTYWEIDQKTPLPAWLAELYIKREGKL